MGAIVGGVVAGLGALGGGVAGLAGASKAGKDAKTVQKRAIAMQRQASSMLDELLGREYELPRLDLSDLQFEPETIDTFSDALRDAQTREQFDAALSQIGETYFPTSLRGARSDIATIQSLLPEAIAASREVDEANVQLRSDAMEAFAPGSSERRRATLEGINSMLNFEVPDALEQQLNRRQAEMAFRTGQVAGPTAARASDRMTYDTLQDNFFRAAQLGQQEQALTSAQVGDAGLRFADLPSSFAQELADLERRTAASLINFNNMVDQRRQNFAAETDEITGNFSRQDQIRMAQANLLIGTGNSLTQQANIMSQAAAEQRNSAMDMLGTGFQSLASGVSSLFNRPPSGTQVGTFNQKPVFQAQLA